ncbi:MAG: radical SAM protein [Rhodospirillaceae bacterium]|nr:radical SAM protein [Rhodospirillales bacterium]
MKVFVKGLNTCPQRNQKMDQYLTFLRGNGHDIVATAEESDSILVWTCGFRGDVRDNSLEQLSAYNADHKGKVIATGCLPQISPTLLAETFDGDIVAWTDEAVEMERRFGTGKLSLAEAESIYTKAALCTDAAQFRSDNPEADAIFHDQFLQLMIAEGCPFKCTYCSERLAFPRFRSFPEQDLIDAAVAKMGETGHYDLMLIADCLGEYGKDTGTSLAKLVRRLAEIEPRMRAAFSNFHPLDFFEDLDNYLALIRTGHIHHLNLPIQSANDRVLKLMARQYSKAQIEHCFGRLNQLGFTEFDTHVIVGFPGETDEEFEETVDFLLTYRPKHVLLSQFMDCEDAAAGRLPGKVTPEIMRRRSDMAEARLREAGILCNNEGSELIQERLRRLNQASQL